jgi:glycosyltransferase involved in cell wall biosynthesis
VASVAIVCAAGIVSGKEIMALELAKGLRDKGCDVGVVTSFWGNEEFRRRLQNENLPVHIMRLGFISATLNLECMRMTLHQMLFWPKLLMDYFRFLKNVRPCKVVHTNWHHVVVLWPFLRPGRDIYWSHEVIPGKAQYKRFFRALVQRVGRFVAVSQAGVNSLSNVGVPKDKITLIYNGISAPAPGGERSDNGVLKIGIVGQVNASKGHEDLFHALKIVVQNHPTVQLHIFGKATPDYEARLKRCACELNVQDNVVWRGFVDDRWTIYQDLSIVIIPSRAEDTLPTTAIEAAFFGIPVVAARKGGLPEIVDGGVTGFLFEAGKVDELAGYLISLADNRQLRRIMGETARDRALSLFTRDRFVRDFCNLLEV